MAKVQLQTTLNDADINDIVAFLTTLTGDQPKIIFPTLPRPTGVTLNWKD